MFIVAKLLWKIPMGHLHNWPLGKNWHSQENTVDTFSVLTIVFVPSVGQGYIIAVRICLAL